MMPNQVKNLSTSLQELKTTTAYNIVVVGYAG
jgi:hypothetical protein